jgi:hypothetical protein
MALVVSRVETFASKEVSENAHVGIGEEYAIARSDCDAISLESLS